MSQNSPGFRSSGKKRRLYHDVANSFYLHGLKKVKSSTSESNHNAVTKSNIYYDQTESQHIKIESVSQCDLSDQPNSSVCDTTPYQGVNEWDIDEISSGCEASPLKLDKTPRLDPALFQKFASPISVPSSFSTPAVVRVLPLLQQTPARVKQFIKQSIVTKNKLKCSNSNHSNHINTNESLISQINENEIEIQADDIDTLKNEREEFHFESDDSEDDDKSHITISDDSPVKGVCQFVICNKSPEKSLEHVDTRTHTPLNLRIDSLKNNSGRRAIKNRLTESVLLDLGFEGSGRNAVEDCNVEVTSWSDDDVDFTATPANENPPGKVYICDDVTPVKNNILTIDDELTPVKDGDDPNLFHVHDVTPDKINRELISPYSSIKMLKSVARKRLNERNKPVYQNLDDVTPVDNNILNIDDELTPVKDGDVSNLFHVHDATPEKINRELISPYSSVKILKSVARKRSNECNKPVNQDLDDVTPVSSQNQSENSQDCFINHETPVKEEIDRITEDETPIKCELNFNSFTCSPETSENEGYNSNEILINDNTPIKNQSFSITEELTPTRLCSEHENHSSVKSKLNSVVTSVQRNNPEIKVMNNAKLDLPKLEMINLMNLYSSIEDSENDKKEMNVKKQLNFKLESTDNEESCLSEVEICNEQCERYAIDSFPSPSKDASMMPCERDDALIAEIPGLTPRKESKVKAIHRENVFLSKRKMRQLKRGGLCFKAVAAVSAFEATRKLIWYEFKVGTLEAEDDTKSNFLKILKFWTDHSSFYLQCQQISSNDDDKSNKHSIIFIMDNKPNQITSNDLIRAYYPINIFKIHNNLNCVIGIARYIKVISDESNIKMDGNFELGSEPTEISCHNYSLTQLFRQYKPSINVNFSLKSSNSSSIREAIANKTLVPKVSIKVTIIHSVINERRICFTAVDENDEYCCIEFSSKYESEIINFKKIGYFEGLRCSFNNIIVRKSIHSSNDIRLKTLIEFCRSDVSGTYTFIYIVSPTELWTFERDFEQIDTIASSSINQLTDEHVDLSLTKRYRIILMIISYESNVLITKLIDSDMKFNVIVDDDTFHSLFKPSHQIIANGILCFKSKLVIDRFTHIVSV